MEKAIITTEAVDRTFEGESCYLKRTIISSFKENDTKKYIVRTERCKYVEIEQQQKDSDGSLLFDENENPVVSTISELKIINKKDNDFPQRISRDEADQIYQRIKGEVVLAESYMDFEDQCEQLALLELTKSSNAWGIPADKWTLL